MTIYYVGCSGWSYGDWRGRFYPKGTRSGDQLPFYAKNFGTVEVNMTFYRYPSPAAVRAWYERTPEDFVFAVKMNRVVTHFQKLRRSGREASLFMDRVAGLEEKLGPVLVQLPPDLHPDHSLLEQFLRTLPDQGEYVLEFRDPDWLTLRTFTMLERYGAAICLTDSPAGAFDDRATSDLAYVRWHGRTGPGYEYSRRELERWARKLMKLPADKVFGFFNNDVGAAAPRNARTLIRLLDDGRSEGSTG